MRLDSDYRWPLAHRAFGSQLFENKQIAVFSFFSYPDLPWFLGFIRTCKYTLDCLAIVFFCHLDALFEYNQLDWLCRWFNLANRLSENTSWVVTGAQIFPLAVASLSFVEGFHTYENHYVEIILVVFPYSASGEHWINFGISWMCRSIA